MWYYLNHYCKFGVLAKCTECNELTKQEKWFLKIQHNIQLLLTTAVLKFFNPCTEFLKRANTYTSGIISSTPDATIQGLDWSPPDVFEIKHANYLNWLGVC